MTKDLVLFIIFLVISIGLSVYLSYIINKKLFPKLDELSIKVSNYLIKNKVKNDNRALIISEIMLLFITIAIIVFLLFYGKEHPFYSCFFVLLYVVLCFFVSTFMVNLRKKTATREFENSKFISSIKNSYFINRLSLLGGRTGMSLYAYIGIIFILITGLAIFSNIPYQAGYVIFIAIPIGLLYGYTLLLLISPLKVCEGFYHMFYY